MPVPRRCPSTALRTTNWVPHANVSDTQPDRLALMAYSNKASAGDTGFSFDSRPRHYQLARRGHLAAHPIVEENLLDLESAEDRTDLGGVVDREDEAPLKAL